MSATLPVAVGYAAIGGSRSLVPKPAATGWDPAAGLLLAGATAVHAPAATDVGQSDTVLIHGASGAVGCSPRSWRSRVARG